MKNYQELNNILLSKLSYFLNFEDRSIDYEQIKQITSLGISEKRAYTLLLENYLNITDSTLINEYLPEMVNLLNKRDFVNNPYYQNITFSHTKNANWELKMEKYNPYEAFVCDDFKYYENGKVIPQIGFFNTPFKYLAVYENKRLWMSITPNEIMTMKEPISKAHGDVVTLGLGLGYFAYMVSLKDNVKSVTIVENDEKVIELFKSIILPPFEYPEKINIIQMDALNFLDNMPSTYDFLFADTWHDAGDGKEWYLKIKPYENKYPSTDFTYWIEKTIKYYL